MSTRGTVGLLPPWLARMSTRGTLGLLPTLPARMAPLTTVTTNTFKMDGLRSGRVGNLQTIGRKSEAIVVYGLLGHNSCSLEIHQMASCKYVIIFLVKSQHKILVLFRLIDFVDDWTVLASDQGIDHR